MPGLPQLEMTETSAEESDLILECVTAWLG